MVTKKQINNKKSYSRDSLKIPFTEIINSTIQFEDSRGPSDQHPSPALHGTSKKFFLISSPNKVPFFMRERISSERAYQPPLSDND